MRWQILLPLVTLVCAVTAPTTQKPLPSPPKEYPTEKGRPKNIRNCRINANTVLPWVVGVWDVGYRQYVGLGSMITYIAFVTSCRQYNGPHTAYKAIGQFIWNISQPEQPCMQEKVLSAIYKHPKCVNNPKEATFFDYAVMRIRYAFDISGPNYPTVGFANTPYELLTGIRYINVIPNTIGCILPYFRNQNEQPPVFNFESFVESIPFYSQCVKLLCEKAPPDPAFSTMCEKRIGDRAKATMLCMKNKNKRHIQLGAGLSYWYAGTPLVCNGTAYGIAAQVKERKQFPYPRWDDIHFIVTFLRVWPWLMGQLKDHSAPWVRHFYVEDMKLKPVIVHSDAGVPAPSLQILITAILYNHLSILD